MKTQPGCRARQYSDQMMCGKCGLQWDVNDPEPPECGNAIKPQPATKPDPVTNSEL